MTAMTHYITKYALSKGIEKVKAIDSSSPGYLRVGGYYNLFRIDRNIHVTEAEAIAAAEAMRVEKIASLKKQIAKLEKLTFKEAA